MVMKFYCEKCGQEYSRETYTRTSDSDSKKYWREKEGTAYGLCHDCWKKDHDEAAAKEMADTGLPELTGSPKQIDWATKIRWEKYKYSRSYHPKTDEAAEIYNRLFGMTEAKFWIDNRNKDFRELIELIMLLAPADVEADIQAEAEKERQAKIQVLQPEKPVDETPVEIKVTDESVALTSKKDNKIIDICHELGYTWRELAWRKNVSFKTGSAIDRAAELGNKLLAAGYPVAIDNPEAAQKAVSAEFEPECKRWVSARNSGADGLLYINWAGRDEELYDRARSLPRSGWDKPYVTVPIRYFREVEDFAGLYGFKLSPGANKAIAGYKTSLEVKAVKPAKAPEEEKPLGLKGVLESGNDILDDLKD